MKHVAWGRDFWEFCLMLASPFLLITVDQLCYGSSMGAVPRWKSSVPRAVMLGATVDFL